MTMMFAVLRTYDIDGFYEGQSLVGIYGSRELAEAAITAAAAFNIHNDEYEIEDFELNKGIYTP